MVKLWLSLNLGKEAIIDWDSSSFSGLDDVRAFQLKSMIVSLLTKQVGLVGWR